MKNLFILLYLLCSVAMIQAQTVKKSYPEIDIPYKKFVLPNGLTLIVHEDHKAPIVAFDVWYHVGSKNEKPGKTGFAHLFEHLMFAGSENNKAVYLPYLESIGGTDVNGTTSNDRTNYFENVPVSSFDKVLWAESDRMGYLLGNIDSTKLALQRGVVQNEKRQGENEPYAISDELTTKNTYPAGHPYSWTVIGEMKDLDSASLNDVKEWFKAYYGPNNNVVVIAGDVNADEVYKKVNKYFSSIPASPPISRQDQWIAKMTGTHYMKAQDRVPQTRLQKTWNTPAWSTADNTYLSLLGDILTNGKSSRLYKRLVYDEQLSSNVLTYLDEREIGSQFNIICDLKPDADETKVNKIINEELQKILTLGPTSAELERAKTNYFANFVNGMQRIGGFGGKSDILARSATFGGTPDYYKKIQQWIKNAIPEDIRNTARQWLSDGEYTLVIEPYGDYSSADSSVVNRKETPPYGPTVEVKFPAIKEFTLTNGLHVAMVERHTVPMISIQLVFNAGFSADQFGKSGLASLTMKMMREGTTTRNALQLSDQVADLGAYLDSYSGMDNSYVYMSALTPNFKESFKLFSDVALNPSFPENNFERVKKEQLIAITQEQSQPFSMGSRIVPLLLYDSGHAYRNPFTGSGTESSVNKITRTDLVKFHSTWFAPNNATLLVVGDIKPDELKAALENNFSAWKKQNVPEKNITAAALASHQSVYIIDKPGAQQSLIIAAEISTSAKNPDYEQIKLMNRILGGDFSSRLNMNLREDKHWTYGAGSFISETKEPGVLICYAPVETDKTKESMAEISKELAQFVADKPITDSEFVKVQKNAIMELPGRWETNRAVLMTLQSTITFDRGINYLNNYPAMLEQLKLQDINKTAVKYVKPNSFTWVIIGDRKKIETGIRDLNYGPLKFIDAEGNEIK